MNIIEKLGGYDKAKGIRDINIQEFDGDASGVMIHYMSHSFLQEDLELALLEHRRENNIFETGDKVIYPWIGNAICVYDSENIIKIDCIHATDEEIKAGHRL